MIFRIFFNRKILCNYQYHCLRQFIVVNRPYRNSLLFTPAKYRDFCREEKPASASPSLTLSAASGRTIALIIFMLFLPFLFVLVGQSVLDNHCLSYP